MQVQSGSSFLYQLSFGLLLIPGLDSSSLRRQYYFQLVVLQGDLLNSFHWRHFFPWSHLYYPRHLPHFGPFLLHRWRRLFHLRRHDLTTQEKNVVDDKYGYRQNDCQNKVFLHLDVLPLSYRVVASRMEGMTPEYSSHSQPDALSHSIFLNGLKRILWATGIESTGRRKGWGNTALVEYHHPGPQFVKTSPFVDCSFCQFWKFHPDTLVPLILQPTCSL